MTKVFADTDCQRQRDRILNVESGGNQFREYIYEWKTDEGIDGRKEKMAEGRLRWTERRLWRKREKRKWDLERKESCKLVKKGGITEQKDEVMEIHFLKSSADSS